jgi:hypothetical protein
MGGERKKFKAHKMPLEYMIMEDETNLMAQMVQDQTIKDFDEDQRQRDRMQDELADIRQILEKIKEAQRVDSVDSWSGSFGVLSLWTIGSLATYPLIQ